MSPLSLTRRECVHRQAGSISLENVSFGVPETAIVLVRHLTLQVAIGENLLITGTDIALGPFCSPQPEPTDCVA